MVTMVVERVMATASATATAGGNTKTMARATAMATATMTTTTMVITAKKATTKTATWIGERRGGRESNLRINGGAIYN